MYRVELGFEEIDLLLILVFCYFFNEFWIFLVLYYYVFGFFYWEVFFRIVYVKILFRF